MISKRKVALITGSSSGIGKEVAILLARNGYFVAVLASKDVSKAESVVRQIEAEGGNAKGYVGDISNFDVALNLVSQVVQDLGSIDGLVNAAGVFMPTPAGEDSLEAVNMMISVNLLGSINTINAAVSFMKKQGDGKIVNFSSNAGITGVPGFSAYCATKGGIVMLTKSLAIELAPYQINVNAIAPGNTATPMNEELRNDEQFSEVLSGIRRVTPSNTLFSDPRDIAAGVLFLLSDSAKPMHGSVLVMDEGSTAGLKL